jgi:hypothetical protein
MKTGFHLITEILITNSSQNTTINILITLNKLNSHEMFSFEMLCKQLVSRVSSGDQTLENNKTLALRARVSYRSLVFGSPDETLKLVVYI